MAGQISIETLVKKPSWKEMLYELIETKELDPWNVDIVELADGFVKKIKDMESMELAIPANIILAASILLRHKSTVLVWEEDIVPPPVAYEEPLPFEEVPPLDMASRLMPKRQITAEELVKEMEGIIRYEAERPKIKRGGLDTIVELPIDELDMEKKIDEVNNKLHRLQDEEGWTLFSKLVENTDDVIPSLMALLHMTQQETIDLRQDEFFGELFIGLIKKKGEAKVVRPRKKAKD